MRLLPVFRITRKFSFLHGTDHGDVTGKLYTIATVVNNAGENTGLGYFKQNLQFWIHSFPDKICCFRKEFPHWQREVLKKSRGWECRYVLWEQWMHCSLTLSCVKITAGLKMITHILTHTLMIFKCYKIAQKVVMEEIIFWKILYIKLNFLTGLFSTQLLVGCKHSIRLTRSSTDPHNKQKIPPKTKIPPKYLQKHCRGFQRELEDIEANVFFAEVFINFLRYFKLALK